MALKRRWLVLGLLASALLAIPVIAAAVATPSTSTAGDRIHFHITAYDLSGNVVYTSDAAVAEPLIVAGRTDMHPLNNTLAYQPFKNVLRTQEQADKANQNFTLDPYLRGVSDGQLIRTPFFYKPFGGIQEQGSVPIEVGPIETDLVLPVNRLAESVGAEREHLEQQLGDLDQIKVGREFLYAGALPARVVSVDDESIRISLTAVDGARIFSQVYGYHFVVNLLEGGDVMLRADVSVGEVIYTRMCESPDGTLMPGSYRVAGQDDARINLTRVIIAPEDHMLNKTLRFDLKVVGVDKDAWYQHLAPWTWD